MTTPTGPISLPISRLRTALSNSATFQAWVSAGSAAAALASVHMVAKATPTSPYAWIAHAGQWEGTRVQQGSAGFDVGAGMLRLGFRATFTATSDLASDFFDFTNPIGAILDELVDGSGSPDDLQIISIAEVRIFKSDPNESTSQGTYYQGEFNVRWKGGY